MSPSFENVATYGRRGRPDMIPIILIENIVNDQPIRKFGDGTATRTWIYISDVVLAFLCALKNTASMSVTKLIECL